MARGYGGSAKSLNDTGADHAGGLGPLGARCELSLRCAAADDTLIPSRDGSPHRGLEHTLIPPREGYDDTIPS